MLQQITAPLLQQIPIFPGERNISARQRGRCGHQQHVAAFLHRHLTLHFHAICLAVQQRIVSGVMRGKGIGPSIGAGIAKNRTHHRFYKAGIIQQEERHGGITDINSGGTGTASTFLGNEQQLAFGILTQFVGRHALPVCQRKQLGI